MQAFLYLSPYSAFVPLSYSTRPQRNVPLYLIQKDTPIPFPHLVPSTTHSPLGTAKLKWFTSSTLSTPERVFVAPSRATIKVEDVFWLRDSTIWPLGRSSRLHRPTISTDEAKNAACLFWNKCCVLHSPCYGINKNQFYKVYKLKQLFKYLEAFPFIHMRKKKT